MTKLHMLDLPRSEVLTEAVHKLQEAATLLRQYDDAPQVLLLLSQLEGMEQGWFHSRRYEGEEWVPDFLIDVLIDLRIEARGESVVDHWRDHSISIEEAEEELAKTVFLF